MRDRISGRQNLCRLPMTGTLPDSKTGLRGCKFFVANRQRTVPFDLNIAKLPLYSDHNICGITVPIAPTSGNSAASLATLLRQCTTFRIRPVFHQVFRKSRGRKHNLQIQPVRFTKTIRPKRTNRVGKNYSSLRNNACTGRLLYSAASFRKA